ASAVPAQHLADGRPLVDGQRYARQHSENARHDEEDGSASHVMIPITRESAAAPPAAPSAPPTSAPPPMSQRRQSMESRRREICASCPRTSPISRANCLTCSSIVMLLHGRAPARRESSGRPGSAGGQEG